MGKRTEDFSQLTDLLDTFISKVQKADMRKVEFDLLEGGLGRAREALRQRKECTSWSLGEQSKGPRNGE